MPNYLVTFTPLAASAAGRDAAERFGHPPFVDASCRREPDLESVRPTMSAICRAANFVPHVYPPDVAAYLTRQGSYGGIGAPHWRLVAVLRAALRFEAHEAAAQWHRDQKLPLPSNCMVQGTVPLPLDHTNRAWPDLAEWDAKYQRRVADHGAFLVCEPLWLDVYEPPIVTREALVRIFGRVPVTRTPPPISDEQLRALSESAGASLNGTHVRRRPEGPVRPKAAVAVVVDSCAVVGSKSACGVPVRNRGC